MASITNEIAARRIAELREFLDTAPEDSPDRPHAAMMLQLWERAVESAERQQGAPARLAAGQPIPVFEEKTVRPTPAKPPTAAQIAEARKNVPAFGRFEGGPAPVAGGQYGAGLRVHLPSPNAFERAEGQPVRVVLDDPPRVQCGACGTHFNQGDRHECPLAGLGTVKPIGGALHPLYTDELVEPETVAFADISPLGPLATPPSRKSEDGASRAWPGTPADAKIGICIGTHGSVAYVHLALELLRIHNPDVRVLIHDDSSEEQDALRSLCSLYGAAFHSTPGRRLPTVGDMSSFAVGLAWGSTEGLDIVVKCSRRFIIAKPFAEGLRELMHNLRYPTACAPCAHFSFGFRSEIVAMAVDPWVSSGAALQIAERVRQNEPHGLPEAWYHELARKVHRWAHPLASGADDDHHPACDYVVRSEQRYGRRNGDGSDSWDAYAWWPLMGLSRVSVVPGVLWHDSHVPADYAALAAHYHLPYSEADFTVTPGE